MKVYVISKNGIVWKTPKGKKFWPTSGAAKVAYTTHAGWRRGFKSFSDQEEARCLEFTLKPDGGTVV